MEDHEARLMDVPDIYYSSDHPSSAELRAVANMLDIVEDRRMILNSIHVIGNNVCAVLGSGDIMLRYVWDDMTGELSELPRRDKREDEHLLRIWRGSREDRIIERIVALDSWDELPLKMVDNIGEAFDGLTDSTLIYSEISDECRDGCSGVLLVFESMGLFHVIDVEETGEGYPSSIEIRECMMHPDR